MKRALCALALAAAARAQQAPPGRLFNLTNWKLQLPLAGKNGGVVEVSQPALSTYTSAYFYGSGASAVFFCPEDGATTSGSSFPRSELRENVDFLIDAKAGGVHALNATVRVLAASAPITIGQLHGDGLSGHCSIIVELEYAAGAVVAHLRDAACGGKSVAVGRKFALGEPIEYAILSAGNTVTVVVGGVAAAPYSYSWLDGKKYQAYFKTVRARARGVRASGAPRANPPPRAAAAAAPAQGDYLQKSGSSKTAGGTVQLDALSTSHS